jgi:hypothetical protein
MSHFPRDENADADGPAREIQLPLQIEWLYHGLCEVISQSSLVIAIGQPFQPREEPFALGIYVLIVINDRLAPIVYKLH